MAAPITQLIASRVKKLRKETNLSGPAFAAKLTELGVKWNRTTVAKFETGLRGSLTVQELLALAHALDVPPAWLLVDPLGGGATPIADGIERDAWTTLWWLTGRRPLDSKPGTRWESAAAPIDEADQIAALFGVYERWMKETAFLEDAIDTNDSRAKRERQILSVLVPSMRKLIDWGYTLPPVPGSIRERAVELGVALPGREG